MEITFAGQITLNDFLQAQSLHRRSNASYALAGLFIIMLIAGTASLMSEPGLLEASWPILAVPVFLIAVMWGVPRLQATNVWKSSKSLQKPLSGTITPEYVHIRDAYAEGTASWQAFIGYKKSPTLILLYRSSNTINIFPKALFEKESDWEAFVSLVEQAVPARKPDGWDKVGKSAFWVAVVVLIVVFIVSLLTALLLGSR